MALFFSRRAYHAKTQKFTNNPASVTRYVAVSQTNPDGTIHKGAAIPQADWLDRVKQAGGGNEVLIYVHGFNTSQTDMLRRLKKIEDGVRAQGFTGAVIAYDWPSDGTVLAYNTDRTDAKKTAPYLVCDGIVPLLNMTPRPKVHLIAHSMGALVVLRGFAGVGDSASAGARNWKVDEVTFCAADVNADWLERGAWGALVLDRRAARFTNYYSGRDEVLAFAGGLINGGRERAGHMGISEPITKGQWDIYCNEQYKRDVPDNEKTQVYSHRWWFDNDGFYKDLALTIDGADAQTMATRRPTNEADLALLT
ncbi:alpha/beta fold hydrolase [Shimia sp.]|uniref:alpha/beta fold hydrolase n=1 Tax=Shimia sp. TaxID=1954381 RepID=UPI003BAD17D2